MQSVEIEKQQSRRLVSLYHSLEYLALTFSPPKRLLIKKKNSLYRASLNLGSLHHEAVKVVWEKSENMFLVSLYGAWAK